MSTALAAAIAGAAGGVAFLIFLFILIKYVILRRRSSTNSRSSETSDPSVQVGRSAELALGGGVSPESSRARNLILDELNAATKNFSQINLIGFGLFGQVYKGLLHDGTIVAIKTRKSAPSQEFVQEVNYLSSIRHRNLVLLLGYCQENEMQMLIYEYVNNGSVSTHLYGASHGSGAKLEFKHRLSIAHGTAKGLSHLHSLNPPMLHKNFKTSNVLVDEDFIPKVADSGLKSLLDRTGASSSVGPASVDDPFVDPEVIESGRFSVQSDVYSFGVFLVELVTGREAKADQSIIHWAQNYGESTNIVNLVDQRMGGNFTLEGMGEFLRVICWCVNPISGRRPPINYVEMEIGRIREKEMSLTTIMGEGTPIVTLGSQLFTSSK